MPNHLPCLQKLKIQEILFEDEELYESYVSRWDQLNASQFENFSSTKALLLIIMMLIVLVASINISSAIVMIVMERKKEIAILKGKEVNINKNELELKKEINNSNNLKIKISELNNIIKAAALFVKFSGERPGASS